MKKTLSLTLTILLLLSLFAGCGSSTPTGTPAAPSGSTPAPSGSAPDAAASIAEEFISMGTSSSGGTFNTLGVAMCQMWNDKIPVTTFSAEVTAGSSENCLRIGMNEIQMAMAAASSVYEAYHGIGAFEGKKVDGITTIGCLYPAIIQFPVQKTAGIDTVQDIAGKKINIGEAGSGSETTIKSILSSLGISTGDFNVQQMSHSNAATALTDEKIDGYMVSGSAGQSHQMTAMASGKCKLVGFTESEVATLVADYPYYYAYTMEAGLYPNQEADVNTIATGTLLICNEALSEELVYQVTKNLFEGIEKLAQSQAIANEISLETALNVAGVALHPGAERYYREVGIL